MSAVNIGVTNPEGWVRGSTRTLVIGQCIDGLLAFGWFRADTYVLQQLPMLTGNIVSFASGAIFAIVVSFATRPHMSKEEVEIEWEKTRDIDNPLSPWVQVYKAS